MTLPYLTISSGTSNNFTSACFILHGLGDSGDGWAHVARKLSRKFPFTKFILPHAPEREVSINHGHSMPAWYDIMELKESAPQDQKGILQSAKDILDLVAQEERNGISKNKIIIGGFSQGGAMALTTGLLFKTMQNLTSNHDQKARFAGIMALGTYIPIKEYFKEHSDKIPTDTPIYMSHGDKDSVVYHDWGYKSQLYLKKELSCKNVKFQTIENIGHSINNEVIDSVTRFIKKHLE